MTEYIKNPLSGKLRGVTYEDGKIIDVHIRDTDDVVKVFVPVRHGRWIGCNGEIVDWDENNPGCPRHSCFCSICKSWLTASDEYPVIAYFCPNCGAKMDGGED